MVIPLGQLGGPEVAADRIIRAWPVGYRRLRHAVDVSFDAEADTAQEDHRLRKQLERQEGDMDYYRTNW